MRSALRLEARRHLETWRMLTHGNAPILPTTRLVRSACAACKQRIYFDSLLATSFHSSSACAVCGLRNEWLIAVMVIIPQALALYATNALSGSLQLCC